MKKSRKALIIIVAALAIAIVAALIFVWTNIDWIVKAAIERYGSQVTKTAVRVSSVKIRLTSGEGAIAGLTVANPRGFSSPYIFRLGKISTKIDTRTVTGSPIVIDEIRIAAPQVVYEMNSSGASNVSLLKKNVQESSGGAPKKTSGGEKAKSKETKIVIKKLVIESGRIDVNIAALGNRPRTATLHRMELTDIGMPGGATPTQVAGKVTTALLEEVGRTVAQAGVEKYLEKNAGGAVKRLLGK